MVLNDTTIDFSLVRIPCVDENFTTIMVVGEVYPTGEVLPFNNTADMPLYKKGGGSFQLYVSEFTLDSILYTVYNNGLLNITIDESPNPKIIRFDTTDFSLFLPGLKTRYGSRAKCKVTFASYSNTTELKIAENQISGSAEFLFGIEAETGPNMYETACSFSLSIIYK
jgi:hypothetical protein